MANGASDKLAFADRAACTAYPYGWKISGVAPNELAVRNVNGTTVQVYVSSDADLRSKVAHFENWRGDKGIAAPN